MPTLYPDAPYNDDFDPAKKFYRILFRPGRAVQARELNQLQTILQNQIESMGRNIFKDGTKISGGEITFYNGSYIKLQQEASASVFEGKTVIGQTSGAKAKVVKATSAFTANSISYPPALHIVYINGEFSENESITIEGTTTSVTSIADGETYTGRTYFVGITSGIFFVKGVFAYTDAQTVVVSPTFNTLPSARIGFVVTESIKTSDDDASLLDPALGTNNYFAPGADRYFVDLQLSAFEYDPAVQNSDIDAITSPNYVEIINIRRAAIVSINSETQFNEIEKFVAKRTFDESGDYTVKPFVVSLKDDIYGNSQFVTAEISPGKAYVRGFEFETISPSYIQMERARDTESENGYTIDLSYSRYTPVKDVAGYLNFLQSVPVQLFNVNASDVDVSSVAAYYDTSKWIGNARARFLEWDSANIYNMYLFDVQMNTGNTFLETNSIIVANLITNTILSESNTTSQNGQTVLTFGIDDTLLFKVPQENIKTYKDSLGDTDTTSTAYRSFNNISFAPSGGYSNATITLTGDDDWIPTGIVSDSQINTNFYVVVTSATGNPPYPGNVISFSGAAGDIIIAGKQAKFVTTFPNGFTANIVGLISTSEQTARVKTLTSNVRSVNYTEDFSNINLLKTDVVAITSIVSADGNIYSGQFALDTGQRDDFYDYGTIKYIGDTLGDGNVWLNSTTNPYLNVTFDYYEHTGSTGFFNVDSYIDGGTDWGDIPSYTKTNGEVIRLSDAIDYRPVRQNDLPPSNYVFVSGRIPRPDGSMTADFSYYLPRRDKLVITKERKFVIVKGIPENSPELPKDIPDAMTIYTFDVPAYTSRPTDIKLTYINNRRFTMRDIGKIEKRVDRLEYYTALSLLEKVAADERIPSAITGIDRFKNGILVDSFAGHNVSDVRNGDIRCSIDFENRTLRPRFVSEHYYYSVNENESSNFKRTGDLLTIDYTPTPFIEQVRATTAVSVTPFDIFEWTGTMTLTPATDVWGDTFNNPAVVVNVNGENDAFTQITLDNNGLTPWGTKYNDWQSVFRGVTDVKVDVSSSVNIDNKVNISKDGKISVTPTATTSTTAKTTLTTEESFARVGLQFSSAQKTITSSIGDRVVDSSVIPYIRSKPITFVAKNLKPDTEVFATFDGVPVNEYCYQSTIIQLQHRGSFPEGITKLEVLSGASVRCEANVLYYRGNVFYCQQNTQTTGFVTGNVTQLTYPSGIITNGATYNTTAVAVTNPEPEALITDNRGIVAGTFLIPNDDTLKFNFGERSFRLADSLDKRFVTTVAETKYLAFGLSTTKEETILATRMNLVSINPLLEVKKSAASTAISEITTTATAVGTSNEVALPINENAIAHQTIFCGDYIQGTEIRKTGARGEFVFKLALGTFVGPFYVDVRTGQCPDQFVITYNGTVVDTGMLSAWYDRYAAGTLTGANLATFNSYNRRLREMGYPEQSGSSIANGWKPYEFYKNSASNEFVFIKVIAPLKETGWGIRARCPTGVAQGAPGTLRASLGVTDFTMTNANQVDVGNRVNQTGKTDVYLRVKIDNTAKNPRFSLTGDDKTVRITNIDLDTSGLTRNEGSVNLDLLSSNEFILQDNTRHPTWPRGLTTRILGTNQNGIGSLPIVLQPGESRFVAIRVQKDTAERIQGRVKLNITAEGPTGSSPTYPVSCNVPVLTLRTAPPTPPTVLHQDPVAQTFFVDERIYDQGIFVSSIDLWFRTKSTISPVILEVRPVVNGYPSSTELIAFGFVVKEPEDVIASTTFSQNNNTRFEFQAPLYLPPGQYCFVVRSNSVEYTLWSARIGDFEINATQAEIAEGLKRVTAQPYIGSLFKSQNSSTWTAEQEEDLTFRVNYCDFNADPSAVVLNSQNPTGNVEYDLFNTSADILVFPDTELTSGFRTTDLSTLTTEGTYRAYNLNTNYPLESRKVVRRAAGNSLRFQFNMATTNRYISPVFDLERIGAVLVRNIINNDATGEDGFSGGEALARYISRRVTLNPGFEAQDLRVYFNAFTPGPSSVKVYYKVNAPGTLDFDTQNKYVEMVQSNVVGDPNSQFAEFTFNTANGECLPGGELFTTFTIKIVMLSPDTTQVPVIKDLRALALDQE